MHLLSRVAAFAAAAVIASPASAQNRFPALDQEPALAIRDVSPKTRTMDVIYRTPVCFNTATKEMVVGW